ncbi:aspartate ammonia-lyase [Arthrobacter sp. 1088]|uniref:aspartate ammonia-lyase n=1 Tax=Arthrobacter sp. 1088 TaxID=2817768 RepID=UPI002862803B|nr:aspartate ammonia-lyase [Arthrobacter sp. 1088]MDR6687746.1 aspartate ammonia-lyase [Arthrobacter sp. 1088]
MEQRTEHDLLGFLEVPDHSWFGIHTTRALANFPITGDRISRYPDFIRSLALVKKAAAQANHECKLLDKKKTDAISSACDLIRDGQYLDQFVVDPVQGGAGTSTNMNANEVIANIALVNFLKAEKGDYHILHPVEHVNLGQSTNDVYPTSLKVAVHIMLGTLSESLLELSASFSRKAVEFDKYPKVGRTQLQDAVPMTLGQEFRAFAHTLREDVDRLEEARELLTELNIGGTAIGTALNAHHDYRRIVLRNLRELTAIESIRGAEDLIEATQDVGVFVQVSGVIKRTATKLSKICSDLRLLSSGPRAGLNEINLPGVQAGSSMMPGKINPVIPEVVNQVAFDVIGNDVTITMAAESGQLQLNAFEPIIARSLFDNIMNMSSAMNTLRERCVEGITANPEHLRNSVERSLGIATLMNPSIGYTRATELVAAAAATGQNIADLAVEQGLISQDQAHALVSSVTSACSPLTT